MEEHPDVFNDPNFSVSMTANNSCHEDMEISLPQENYMVCCVYVHACSVVCVSVRVCVCVVYICMCVV